MAALAACGLLLVAGMAQSQSGFLSAAVNATAARVLGVAGAGLTFAISLHLTKFRRQHPSLVRAAWSASALLVGLVLWAVLSPKLHLPQELGALQNAGAVAFFLTVLYLAVGTAPLAAAPGLALVSPRVRRWVLVAGVVMVSQMLLGALVRYAGATGGALWANDEATAMVFRLHRIGSMATVALVSFSAVAMYIVTPSRPWLRGLAGTVVLLVVAQALLGVRAVAEVLPLTSLQAHIGLGVALLAAEWGLYLGSAPPKTAHVGVSLRALGRELIALTKPRISVMVIATFGGGLWLAPQTQQAWRAMIALAGTLLIVGAANALNMYLERDIDRLMKRTRNRPLPQGRLSADAAVATGTALLCLSLPLMLIGGNGLTCLLGFVAFASYVFMYTPLKQKSSIALFVGAVPGALPPLMGWTTATDRMDLPGLVLFGILFLWQIPHFLAISVFRVQDYTNAGFKVMPAEYGMRATRAWALWCAVAMVGVSLSLVPLDVAGWLYGASATLLGLVFIGWTAAGYRVTVGAPASKWGKSLFAYSIVYLMLLFAALSIDHLVG
ncbi:MAG: heme o synthase [Deltaproteobacteria bacterium]|nr:heme o synthase [Deltaproteobacteria bacterium]